MSATIDWKDWLSRKYNMFLTNTYSPNMMTSVEYVFLKSFLETATLRVLLMACATIITQ